MCQMAMIFIFWQTAEDIFFIHLFEQKFLFVNERMHDKIFRARQKIPDLMESPSAVLWNHFESGLNKKKKNGSSDVKLNFSTLSIKFLVQMRSLRFNVFWFVYLLHFLIQSLSLSNNLIAILKRFKRQWGGLDSKSPSGFILHFYHEISDGIYVEISYW